MNTMIIYMSTHGCTENVSKELASHLNGEVVLRNLKEDKNPDFSMFDRVIIGGSIHAGQVQRKLKAFCENNLELLGRKEIGLFICCMEEGETAYKQLNEAFPEKLHQYSKAEAILGGEFNFDKMRFFEKVIVKKIAKVEESVSKVNHEAIEKFAKRMDKTFAPFLMLV
ncbi:flavodoxin domain-containing protein [Sunxiuqinia sp. A32]|uniref:flavodoxin domain-containing protein n=1 Tax=Sunxiuqinia sp. A32 TaxID=3461496 RepID=UPI004045C89E